MEDFLVATRVERFLDQLQQRAGKPNCTEIIGILLRGADDSTVKTLFHLKKVNRCGEGSVWYLQGYFGAQGEGS